MSTCQHLPKSLLFSSIILLTLFSMAGCSNNHQVSTSETVIIEKPVELTKESDKQFLIRAVELKYEQILLGKLAQTRSSSEEVKSLAKMLEEANRNSKSSLASLGITKSIAVPSAPTQAAHEAYNRLNEASVDDFDYTYIGSVIRGYNDLISHFENAATKNLDPEIQSKAIAMLPDMRNHLSKAKEMDAHMNPVSEVIR